MKPIKLSTRQVELLTGVLGARAPHMKLDLSKITSSEINLISNLILDEFSERGLNSDDEPNSLGLELEEIIDSLRRGIS